MTRPQASLDILLALALTVAAGLIAAVATPLLTGRLGLPLLATLSLQGVLILIGLQLLLRWRRTPWGSLRLPAPRLGDLGRGLLALGAVLAVNVVLNLVLSGVDPSLMENHQQRLSGIAGSLTDGLSFAGIAATALFIGFYEEALARGFLLRRSEALLGGSWGPALLSSLLFGLGHFYQGWTGVLQTALIGLVLARLSLHWGSLWPAIVAHALLNTLSLSLLRTLDNPPL